MSEWRRERVQMQRVREERELAGIG